MLSCRHQLVERILKAKSANPATDTAVNGGGKVDHMGAVDAPGVVGEDGLQGGGDALVGGPQG